MIRILWRGTLLALVLTLVLGAIWLGVGLLRPLEPFAEFGSDHPALAITDVAIVDVEAGRLIPHQTVLIEAGRIKAIQTAGEASVPATHHRIDGRGKFLLPGLWDAHVHTVRHSSRLHFALLLASGVTAVRNLGDGCSWGDDLACPPDRLAWAGDGAVAVRLMPQVAATTSYHFEEVTSADDARQTVQRLAAKGDTLIKLQLPDDVPLPTLRAILDEAKRNGLPVAGHLPKAVDLDDLPLDAFTSIEHDEQLLAQCELQARKQAASDPVLACTALLRKLAAQGVAFVPTQVASTGQEVRLGQDRAAEDAALAVVPSPIATLWRAYRSLALAGMSETDMARARQRHRQAQQLTRLAHELGVPLLAGTDALDPFVMHGAALHDELALLAQSGLPHDAVLRAATLAPARHAGQAGQRGSVVPGAHADLLLLRGNPLERVDATRQIEAVIKAGRVHAQPDLAALRDFAARQAGSHAMQARLWAALLGIWSPAD